MSEEKMRAVRIVSHEGAGELGVCEVARPRATADRVRVRVRAAGLNRADLLQKRGRYPAPPGAVAGRLRSITRLPAAVLNEVQTKSGALSRSAFSYLVAPRRTQSSSPLPL